MSSRYEDERGVIQDILGPVDAITEITTKAGMVRGNHIHQKTVQWTYVISGSMTFAWLEEDGVHEKIGVPGMLIIEPAGIAHAWKAIEDTKVLVFTSGPRSGEAYETDTIRLHVPLF